MTRRSKLSPEAALLLQSIEDRRKAKSRARIAKMHAKRRGHTKRMPLTGKAALKAIRDGAW